MSLRSFVLLLALAASNEALVRAADTPAEEPAVVSYYRDVRPIFQQHCQGCHQPARSQGGYVMTSHADLLKAGESEKAGVVPGKPDDSELLKQILPRQNGKAPAMPKNKPALFERDAKLV